MKNTLKKKTVYIPLIILALLIIGGIWSSGSKKSTAERIEVARGTLVQEVTVSGTVKPTEAVDLAFERSGRIRRIGADVGAKVYQGTLLIALESEVEQSAVEDAEAKLASKQAHYNDLKSGGRPEQVSVKETELAKAKSDLSTYYASVPNIILDAYNKADNAVHRQADILFSNPLSTNPQLSFTSNDQQAVFDAQNGRFTVEASLASLKKIAQATFATETENETALAQAKTSLLTVNDFLIKTSRALNAAINLSEATLATDKDALSTARTNVNTAITSVTDQIQSIATQKISVQTAAADLTLTKVGATPEVLAGAEADIKSADANVRNARAVLAKTYILSPISGVVTKQDAKVGQIAPANTTLIAVSSGNFKIEAFVPEVDVAKISVGNPATITLDAYGSDVSFKAHVIKIDPAETMIDGVSTYKTSLEFDGADARIRSGMTANTTIVAATRENVVNIPQRAVFEKDGKKFVRVSPTPETTEDREVTVGIRGSSGNIEILQGLTEGEWITGSGK